MTPLRKRWLVVVLLVLSLGTPWTLLQSVAWLRMVVHYSRQTTFVEAVSMTFDGKHPCRLCCLVKEGQAKERQEQKKTVKPEEKLQLGLPPRAFVWFHPPMLADAAEGTTISLARNEPPPLPPPRLA